MSYDSQLDGEDAVMLGDPNMAAGGAAAEEGAMAAALSLVCCLVIMHFMKDFLPSCYFNIQTVILYKRGCFQ